jgi:hypothetical protein
MMAQKAAWSMFVTVQKSPGTSPNVTGLLALEPQGFKDPGQAALI